MVAVLHRRHLSHAPNTTLVYALVTSVADDAGARSPGSEGRDTERIRRGLSFIFPFSTAAAARVIHSMPVQATKYGEKGGKKSGSERPPRKHA
jgi:hypothetical protein